MVVKSMEAYVFLSAEQECVVRIYASGQRNFLTSKKASKTSKIGNFVVFNSSISAKPKKKDIKPMYAYVFFSPEYECVVRNYASGHKNTEDYIGSTAILLGFAVLLELKTTKMPI